MSAVTPTTFRPSVLAAMNSYLIEDETPFFNKFGWGKAKAIATDECKYSQKESVTSFEVGDCITIFALEKEDGKNKAIIGWHISNGSSVKKVVKELGGFEHNNPYDIYIVGGTEVTTEGEGCLLNNIRQAINTK